MKLEPLPIEWITKIFMRLHGRFGNTFFDKFRIGELNQNGQDIGIENAKIVWSQELAGTSPERIAQALMASYEYAPSCDDFKSNCYVRREFEDYKAIDKKIDREANAEYAKEVVDFVASQPKVKRDHKQWARDLVSGKNKSNWYRAIDFAKEALEIQDEAA